MQQPSQDDRVGLSSAFSTNHSNPYDQQRQSYVPPNQHDMLVSQFSQGFTSDPQRGSLSSELEVKQIEQRLSSGRYLCYNCWLYVMFISALFTFAQLAFNTPLSTRSILYAIECFIVLNYSVAMIGALKHRTLAKAKNGYKIAIACLVALACCLAFDTFEVLTQYTMRYMIIYFAVQVPVLGLYFFFAIFNPALKVKQHLERRDLLQQRASGVYEDI